MASKRGVRRRQCGNKRKLTKQEAIERASRMGRERPGESYDGYPCACGSWHVGHRPSHIHREIRMRRAG